MNYSKIDFSQRNVGIDLFRALTIVAVAIFFLAGIISRQFWILVKLGATPTWVFFVTAISIGTYAILSWLAEIGKASWFNVIKPAGTATPH